MDYAGDKGEGADAPGADHHEHNDQGNRLPDGSASGIRTASVDRPLPTGDHREHEVLAIQQTFEQDASHMQHRQPHDSETEPGVDVADKGYGLGGKQCAQQSRTAGSGFGEQPAQHDCGQRDQQRHYHPAANRIVPDDAVWIQAQQSLAIRTEAPPTVHE